MTNLPDKFTDKFTINDEGCWIWNAWTNKYGYGRFHFDGTKQYVHRIAYKVLIGPIPDGLVLDHLCRVRNCCNPQHLEPVTNAENSQRGINYNRDKTHCPQGHEYSVENTYTYIRKTGNVNRKCRTCMNGCNKEYQQRMRYK